MAESKAFKQAKPISAIQRGFFVCFGGFFVCFFSITSPKTFKLKWDVTMKLNLLEIKSINHIVLHLVLFLCIALSMK